MEPPLKSLNKKGSVTVYVTLFFVTLTAMIFSFVQASEKTAVETGVRKLGSVWTASVLAEYDRNLMERYGLFAFYGTPQTTSKKLGFYGNETFRGKEYIDFRGATCSLNRYSMADVDIVKRQIVRMGELESLGELKDLSFHESDESGISNPYFSGEDTGIGGEIRNPEALRNLPSAGSSDGITISGLKDRVTGLTSLPDIVSSGTDAFFEEKYLFRYFKDGQDSRKLGRTFFRNEIEYVICGKKRDDDNLEGVRLRIIAIREAANLAYLLKDPVKQSLILEAAAAFATPAGAPAVAAVIETGWALVESVNDYRLLIRGKKVPFIKDEASWATDLDSIFAGSGRPSPGTGESVPPGDSAGSGAGAAGGAGSGESAGETVMPEIKTEVGLIDPGNTHGETYQSYLRFLTALLDENIRILRMMDIIQLNMQNQVSPGFLLRDHYSGLEASFNVNGSEYEIENEYQPEKP